MKIVMYKTLLHRYYYVISNSKFPTLTQLKTLLSLHCPNQRTGSLLPLPMSYTSSKATNTFIAFSSILRAHTCINRNLIIISNHSEYEYIDKIVNNRLNNNNNQRKTANLSGYGRNRTSSHWSLSANAHTSITSS